MSSIRVTTPQATYDVTIAPGLLRTLHQRLRKLTPGKSPKTFVITSPKIWALWHERFLASFPADQQPTTLFLPAGERHKRLATVESLAQQLVLAGEAERDLRRADHQVEERPGGGHARLLRNRSRCRSRGG